MTRETPWTIAPSRVITFFCRHCGRPEHRHAEGHCLFETTVFAYESHAKIANRLLENRFFGQRKMTMDVVAEAEAFLQQTLEDLKRDGIPNDP